MEKEIEELTFDPEYDLKCKLDTMTIEDLKELFCDKESVIQELLSIRNDLYNKLPVGDIDSFELIKIIKIHIERIDKLIKSL